VTAALKVEDAWKTYRLRGENINALAGVNFCVETDEFVAVCGPSGSGKTTLLNLAIGLDRPTKGSVNLFGNELNSMREGAITKLRARCVGIVFQDALLLPGLTALENVIAGKLPHSNWKVLGARAKEILEMVGLGDRVDFAPSRLSGGERQRVAIARSLVGEPSLLVADEPTGQLDTESTQRLLDLLERLKAELRFTLVVVTHDPIVASRAGRVLNLAAGRVSG
jgi:putative ABC transport system ATP-binding protein